MVFCYHPHLGKLSKGLYFIALPSPTVYTHWSREYFVSDVSLNKPGDK